MTTRQYKLTPFTCTCICGRKYFVSLIYVVESDWQKNFHGNNFPSDGILCESSMFLTLFCNYEALPPSLARFLSLQAFAHVAGAARMANRVITVTQGEIENSEDPEYKASLQQGVEGIKQCESREG